MNSAHGVNGEYRGFEIAMYNLRDSVASSYGRIVNTSVSDWLCELTQLERGEARAKTTMHALNEVLIGKASMNHTSLHRIKAPPGYVSIVFSGNGFGTMFVGGYRIAQQDCIVLSSNAEVEVVTHRQSDAVSVAVSERSWGEDARRLPNRGLLLRPGIHLVSCSARSMTGLQNRINAAQQACDRMADAAANPSLRQAIADSLIEQLKRVASDPPFMYSQRRERNRRHTGVELARHYIREHLTDPIRLSDLCSHTHLRPRSLEYGFHEILRVSPMCYVKVLRLNAVHRQLISNTRVRRSISEIALDAGFRHLSQFAVDYKRLFLESPSAMRRRVAASRFTMAHGPAPPS